MAARGLRLLKFWILVAVFVVLATVVALSQWRNSGLRQLAERADQLHLRTVYHAAEIALNLVQAREARLNQLSPPGVVGAHLYLAEQSLQQLVLRQARYEEYRLADLVTELGDDIHGLQETAGAANGGGDTGDFSEQVKYALLRADQIKRMHQIWNDNELERLEYQVRRDWLIIAGAVALLLGAVFALVSWLMGRVGAATDEREVVIEKLVRTNDELSRFTYTVSHDLKSPLVTVAGFVDVMTEELDAGNRVGANNAADRIREAVIKMEQLLNGLLKLSRSGRTVEKSDYLSGSVLFAKAVAAVNSSGHRKIMIDVQPNMPIVHADAVRLCEALQNLIENAVKYMGTQQHPQIRIGCRDTPSGTVFFVADNGAGIDPADLERVFELFERADENVEGSGIGLAMARRVIEAHGGKLWAESPGAGKGSTFFFSLA